MGTVTIIPSDGWQPSLYSSLRSEFTAGVSIINTAAEASFATNASAATLMVSSNRNAAAQRLLGAAGVQKAWRATPEPQSAASGARDALEIGVQHPTSPAEAMAPVTDQPKPPPTRQERVELVIDSLQNYELLKPIKVVVESLGDKVFMAEAPDLNVSTSGNSIGDALILLKNQITNMYEDQTSKKNLDGERSRQFKVLETYIGRPRRNWM
jgi:hypothetical protein